MITALRYEWTRLRSLRLTWWLAGASAVVTALAAWGYSGVILGMRSDGLAVDNREAVVLVVSKPSMAPVVAGILGVFAVGNEYRHGTMRLTLLVTPRRATALGAKAALVAGFGAVLALANLAVAWVVGALVLAGAVSLSLSVAALIQFHLAQVLLVAGWALIGVALAAVLRSQAFALAVLLAIPFAIEPAVRTVGMLSGQTWLERTSGFLPFTAGSAMADISDGVSNTLLSSASYRLGPLVSGVVFFGVIGVLGIAAFQHFRSQDV